MVSTLCVGFSGSKSTRLLKHGIAGHMVEIVALSWMAKPCGRSSRNLSVSQAPDLGAWPWEATPVTNTSPARPITERNRVILITHLRFQSLSILVGRQSARAISATDAGLMALSSRRAGVARA